MTPREDAAGPSLVTGATYFLGAHVARALARRGEIVRCLPASAAGEAAPARGPGAPERRAAVTSACDGGTLHWLEGGVQDSRALRRAAEGCAVVYHCDEDYRVWTEDPAEVYRHNVEGTRRVLQAARAAGVERVVHTSSVGCLGRIGGGGLADEETPVRREDTVGHYQRSKFMAERVVDEAVDRGVPVVVVNPPASVGEMDFRPTPVGRLVVDFLNRSVPAYMEAGRNFVDARDVARGHLLAAERGVPGRRYVLGGRNLTVREFLELLSRLTGLPAPRVRMPQWVALAYAGVQEARERLLGGRPRLSLEEARAARQKLFFDASRAERELGWTASPLEEALERAVRWFREGGYLESTEAYV